MLVVFSLVLVLRHHVLFEVPMLAVLSLCPRLFFPALRFFLPLFVVVLRFFLRHVFRLVLLLLQPFSIPFHDAVRDFFVLWPPYAEFSFPLLFFFAVFALPILSMLQLFLFLPSPSYVVLVAHVSFHEPQIFLDSFFFHLPILLPFVIWHVLLPLLFSFFLIVLISFVDVVLRIPSRSSWLQMLISVVHGALIRPFV